LIPFQDLELLPVFESIAAAWGKNFTLLGTGGDHLAFKAMFKQDITVTMKQFRPDNVVATGEAQDVKIFCGAIMNKPDEAIMFETMVQGLVAKLNAEEYDHTDCNVYGVKLISPAQAHCIFEFKRFNKSGVPYDGGLVLVDCEFVDGGYLFTRMWTWPAADGVKKAPEPVQKIFSETRGQDESNPQVRVRGFLKSKFASTVGQDGPMQENPTIASSG